jgi:mono/diheme cytochrome c family protein
MSRSITITAAVFGGVLLASIAMRVTVSAGGGQTQGATSTVNQKVAPLKVTQRAYDSKKLLSVPPLSEEAKVGRALWQQRCAYCHDGMGQASYKTIGPWIDSETVGELGADALKGVISSGTSGMPAFKYDLDAQQMNDMIEFLKTVPPSLKPAPAQLEGKSPAGNNAE